MKKNALFIVLCSLFSKTKDENIKRIQDNPELRKFYLPLLEEGIKQFVKKHRISMEAEARNDTAVLILYQNIVSLQYHFPQRHSATVLLDCNNIVMWRNRNTYFEIVTVFLKENGNGMYIEYRTEKKGSECQTDTIALTK